MNVSTPIVALAALLGTSLPAVSASVFVDLTFYHDGDSTPSGFNASNIADATVVSKGVLEVDGSLIQSGGLASFASGAIKSLSFSYTDQFGAVLSYDYPTSPNNFTSDDFGALFDTNGQFLRFDSPSFSTCSGCFFIFDPAFNQPVSTLPGPSATITDDDDFNLGYLLEDIFRFNNQYVVGDVVKLSDFADAKTQAFANNWRGLDSKSEVGSPIYTGVIVGQNRTDVTPVPLPAALPLLAGGVALLGFAGWRRGKS